MSYPKLLENSLEFLNLSLTFIYKGKDPKLIVTEITNSPSVSLVVEAPTITPLILCYINKIWDPLFSFTIFFIKCELWILCFLCYFLPRLSLRSMIFFYVHSIFPLAFMCLVGHILMCNWIDPRYNIYFSSFICSSEL
jgi:hypothetical protein